MLIFAILCLFIGILGFKHNDYDGNYSVNASYPGDGTYLPSNGTGIIEVVPKVATEISVDVVSAHPGDNVTVSVNVTADDGVPFNGNVTIIFPDGSSQTVEVIDGAGNATWTVPDDLVEGDYPVDVTFDGDDNYLPSNGTGTVTVEKVPTEISVGNVTAHPGDSVTIPINVAADDGVPFNGDVTIVLPDGSTQTVEIINGAGNATWTVPRVNVSQYNDTVSFDGNNRYLPSNSTGIISVILVDVQLNITVDKSVVYYGDVVEFVIAVLNNGPGDATNVTVRNVFSDGFEYISDNCSDADYQNIKGLLRASTLAQSYDPSTGVWYIGDLANGEEAKLSILAYAKFIGTEDVNSSVSIAEIEADKNGTVNVTVIQVPTHISVGNVTARPGDDVAIPVDVAADDDVPFSGNITVILPDGSNQTVEIINGTDNVAWTVPEDFKEGDYPVGAAFQGNNRYLPCEGQGTVTVFTVPVDMIVGNVDAKPGEDVTIPIKVVPRDGSVFNGKVTVELPDGTVKVVEIVNGEGSVVWTIPENFYGEYIVRVSFNGTGAYCPANGTCIITVIADVHPAEENKTSPVKPVDIKVDNKVTGNLILALLMVLALLGVSINRRK